MRNWSLMWWPPTTVSRPWCPAAFRGCDEWHNPSWGIVVPFAGAVIVFRMHHARTGMEHLHLWTKYEGWEGHFDPTCRICLEILADHDAGHR